MRRSPRRSATTRRRSRRSSACSSSRPTRRGSSSSSASSITSSAATRWRAAISRKWSPIRSVPPEIAAKVRLYLQQLAIEAEPPPFAATIFSGIRWESNANAAPATQTVTLNGIDFTLDYAVGRGSRLERRQYRHAALWLRFEEPGRPHRVRRPHLQRELFRAHRHRPQLLRGHARSVLQSEAHRHRIRPASTSTESATRFCSATINISRRVAAASAS